MSNPRVWFITGCTSGLGRALVDIVRGLTGPAETRYDSAGQPLDLIRRGIDGADIEHAL